MEKFKVSFTAENQQLKANGTKHASDTYADIEAEFVLGNRWTDMDSVSAVWWNDFTRIATVLDSQGKCIVPHEVLTRKGCVRVNLVGSVMEGDELVTRLTSYSAEAVQVNEKIKLTGTETSEITPSQFEQFVAVVISEVEKVTGMTAEAVALPAGSDATARYENGVLHLGIPQGIQGETGNGIESVAFDNYTLRFTFTDGTVFTTPSIRGAEGNGIGSIAKTGTSGLVDTYTITFDDGSTTTYTVANGAKGDKGDTGATPSFSIGTVETLEPTEDATATITGTAENPVLNLGIPQGRTGEVTYEDLESILPRDTASGQIASFPDGQSVIPMHSLKVSLEPIQDLHGYDKPWVGGGGKNKLPTFVESGSGNGLTWTANPDGTLTVNGTATATTTINAPVSTWEWDGSSPYWLSGCPTGGSAYGGYSLRVDEANGGDYSSFDIGSGAVFNTAGLANKKLYFRAIIRANTVCNNITFKPQLEQGSTTTDYEPYSNICPISGHTEVVTHRTGVNVWDEEWEVGTYSTITGEKVASTTQIRSKNYIRVLPNTDYYLKTSPYAWVLFFDANQALITAENLPSGTKSNNALAWGNTIKTTPSNCHYIAFYEQASYGNTYNNDISINYPSTDHEYHAHDGHTYTTSLGRTVYGGTLDVVSGELVVDRAMVDASTLTFAKYGVYNVYYANVATKAEGVTNIVSDMFAVEEIAISSLQSGQMRGSVSNKNIYLGSDKETLADFNAWVQESKPNFCYELATPQTIQLTPTEVRTLLGTNNVWSDGDVVVVYSADTALWIEKKLNA